MSATPTRGGVAIVSRVENVEKSRETTELVLAQRRNMGQHCVEVQVDDALMSWRYSVQLRKRVLMLADRNYKRPFGVEGEVPNGHPAKLELLIAGMDGSGVGVDLRGTSDPPTTFKLQAQRHN